MPSIRQRNGPPVFYGPAMIAVWLGVPRTSVTNWLSRYDDIPEPAGQIHGPQRVSYFWRLEQREDWVRWAHGKDVTVPAAMPD